MAEIAVRVIVEGRVQGVGYRVWAVQEAWRRNVRGWVRNRRDGSVEALLIGSERRVEALIEAFREGPRAARVTGIAREPASDDGTPRFYERPTV
jgi:acylphosphatase